MYFNGIPAPLFFVSPTQINAQIPWEVNDTTSINAYVRSEQGGGVVTTTPVAVTIVPANPGIFTSNPKRARPWRSMDRAAPSASCRWTAR